MTKKQTQTIAARRVLYALTITDALFPSHSAASRRRVKAAQFMLNKLSTGELRSLWLGAVQILK